MKFFAFIMAFLVLVLNCLPCADGAIAIQHEKLKAEFTTAQSSSQESDHNDACSPFCQCSCCATFSINHVIAAIPGPHIFASTLTFSYLPATAVEISLPVWQPPQLS
jgi:hypothetical protein